jgi:nitroreductase
MSAAGSDLADVLRQSRNVRSFTSQPVPPEALAGILEAARWTGSASNAQPWQFIVVDEADTLRALAASSPSLGWLASAPLAIVLVLAGESRQTEAFDEGRLAERIFLAARAYGLAAGIGWFLPGEPRERAHVILGVPEGRQVRTVIAIGAPAPGPAPAATARREPRKPLVELVHRNRYGDGAPQGT